MNTIVRFCIVLVMTLVLSLGQGSSAIASMLTDACQKPGSQMAMHSCCEQKADQQQKTVKKKPCCQCAPISKEYQTGINIKAQDDFSPALINTHFTVIHSLQVADTEAPIWLHKLFYPDKSSLYLEQRHLLL